MSVDLRVRSELTRRRLLGAGAALGFTALTGCSSDDSSSPAPTASATPRTRPFVDVTGRIVQVPDRAERIVAIHDINAGGQLLSLGAPVVGIADRGAEGDRADLTRYFDLAGITRVGPAYEPNLEVIAAVRPDLIVGEGYNGGGMFVDNPTVEDRLRDLAPVVYIDTFRPVEAVMADFVALLGGGAVAAFDQQKAELDERVGELRALLGDRWDDVTAAFIAASQNGLAAWGPTSLPELDVLTRAGVTWVDPQKEAGEPGNGGFLGDISLERMSDFSADLLLVATFSGGDAMLDEPLFQALPAVEAGQVVELSEESAGSNFPNYLFAAQTLLDALRGRALDTDLV